MSTLRYLLCASALIFIISACTQKEAAKIEIHDVFEEVDLSSAIDFKKYKTPSEVKEGRLAYYKAESGDDIILISKKNNIEISEIVKINDLKPPYRITPGQVIYLPKKEVISNEIAAKPSEKKVIRSKFTNNFILPVKGSVISKFGPKSGGINNNGINIKASLGANVKAAADGEVIYVGESVKGFGNIVIIKHNEEWVSAYAHNKEVLVNKGDYVKQGKVIAYVGKTGDVKIPQLHFALRKGGKSVDPLKYTSS